MIDSQSLFQWRNRSLVTICSFTYSAAYTDGLVSGVIRHIQIISIDHLIGMPHLAPQPDRIAAGGRAEGAARFGDVAGKAKIAYAIRRFGELADNPSRRFECLVDVPKGASPAIAGKL